MEQRICPHCAKFEWGPTCSQCGQMTVTPAEWRSKRVGNSQNNHYFHLKKKAADSMNSSDARDYATGMFLGVLGFLLVFLLAYLTIGVNMGF
jgi:hypothetical protein